MAGVGGLAGGALAGGGGQGGGGGQAVGGGQAGGGGQAVGGGLAGGGGQPGGGAQAGGGDLGALFADEDDDSYKAAFSVPPEIVLPFTAPEPLNGIPRNVDLAEVYSTIGEFVNVLYRHKSNAWEKMNTNDHIDNIRKMAREAYEIMEEVTDAGHQAYGPPNVLLIGFNFLGVKWPPY